jgi:hypothetical protein
MFESSQFYLLSEVHRGFTSSFQADPETVHLSVARVFPSKSLPISYTLGYIAYRLVRRSLPHSCINAVK